MTSTTTADSRQHFSADRQGELGPAERVDAAMASFARSINARTAMNLDACIHCGMCAEACHFYLGTEDPKYTPILKAEPLKQAYKRENGAFAPIYRWLGLKRPISEDELAEWQHLVYDSCNLCGRCSLVCPVGIDVAGLVEETRQGMFDAGLAPQALYEAAANQYRTGVPRPGEEPYRDKLLAIGDEHGVSVPVDRSQADAMITLSSMEVDQYPAQVAALAKVMERVGGSYTFRSDALLADNYAYYAGGREWQKALSRRLIDEARACGAAVVVVPECGHCYTALRWEAAELEGESLPFRVLHVTEYLAEELDAGRLRLNSADVGSVAFHDPCQLVRKGGAGDAPRSLLRAMGIDVREQTPHRGFGFCCGGGGGVNLLKRADELRHHAVELKLAEVDAADADQLLTSCAGCRYSFDDALQHSRGHYTAGSLLELVADHIEPNEESNR